MQWAALVSMYGPGVFTDTAYMLEFYITCNYSRGAPDAIIIFVRRTGVFSNMSVAATKSALIAILNGNFSHNEHNDV